VTTINRRAGRLATRAYMAALPARRRLATDDRRVLEDQILPAIVQAPVTNRLLFVGCSEATSWYPAAFGLTPGVRFETVDPDPKAGVFGSRRRHTVGRLESLVNDRSRMDTYDAVLLNGIFNYGTDDDDAKRSVLAAAHRLLRDDALLLIGHREPRAGKAPDLDLALLDGASWRPCPIPGLSSAAYRTLHSNGHTFRAWRKVA
jgi:hypothetical protein